MNRTQIAGAALLCAAYLGTCAWAAPKAGAKKLPANVKKTTTAPAKTKSPEEALFSPEGGPEAFAAAVEKAKAAGVPAQTILEARIARAAGSQDKDQIGALAADMAAMADSFDAAHSRLFNQKEDFLGMTHAFQGIDARNKGDMAGFETHIKEAFWLSPRMAQYYAEIVSDYRKEQKMANFALPMDLKLQKADGGQTTLKDLVGSNKALLLDFWASWCGPCMASMDELKARGAALPAQGVVVAALNTEHDSKKALGVKTSKHMTIPWLLEPEGDPYSKALDIDSIPRAILLSADGKVLYNGHPADPALQTALKKLGVTLKD